MWAYLKEEELAERSWDLVLAAVQYSKELKISSLVNLEQY